MARFAGLELLTAPGRVMTPRPATERLVERGLERLAAGPARVADVGSGSGAIAVALALGAPRAEIWAVDVSLDAVELIEALVAADLGAGRTQQAADHLVRPSIGLGAHAPSLLASSRPSASSRARSLRRASCSVL